jgi:hypothetical protein
VAVRGIGQHLWIAGTIGQRYFVKTVELIAKEKDVAEAFFDQLTTAARNVLERIGLSRKRPHAMTQADISGLSPVHERRLTESVHCRHNRAERCEARANMNRN